MKLNYSRTALIGFAFMSICAFWGIYENVIPLILKNTFGYGETKTGVIMAMDNVFALILLPIFGALSDKTNTKLGKRIPYIIVGTIIAFIFIILLPIADQAKNIFLFMGILFMVLLSMSFYRSPAVALMPDLTPKPLRSKANAIINLMGAVGAVFGLIMIKLLVSNGESPNYFNLFFVTGLFMLFSVAILVMTIKEKKLSNEIAQKEKKEEQENPLLVEDKNAKMPHAVFVSLCFLLSSVFLWFCAYNAVTTAFSRYTEEVWEFTNNEFSTFLMIASIAAILSYFPVGMLSSKFGRKKMILIGIVLMISAFLSGAYMEEAFVKNNILVSYIPFAIIGIGWATINVNSYPMVVEMSRNSNIGKYTGLYYTFSMAAQILTPVLSGFLLEQISYRTLFPYAVAFSVLAFITMLFVKHGDSKPGPSKKILESFEAMD